MSGRYVPWASWREWEDVRYMLYSDTASSVHDGLTKVMGWRRRGKVPLGVDITALLLATALKDPHGPGPSSSLPAAAEIEASLQAEYSLTIIRLVNGVSDSCQKGKVAGSVAKNADSAGLHPMLVEIRHEATHNHVPSLHMLRLAASHSLSWLHSNYWSAQSDRTLSAASESCNVLERLLSNQSARAAVSASSGISSQPSDSDADATDPSESGMSPAALKKQQKALLGQLRPIIPSSHPADLASMLLHAACRSPGISAEAFSNAASVRSRSSTAVTLTLLSSSYDDLLSHVLVQSINTLRDAKIALQLRTADTEPPHRATGEAAGGPPLTDVQSAAMWAAAALQASEISSEVAEHQLLLSYALQQLFKPAALMPPPHAHQPQDSETQQPHVGIDALLALYSSAVSGTGGVTPPAVAGQAEPHALAPPVSASTGQSRPGQQHKRGAPDLETSNSHTSAVMAMLTTEHTLLQLCKDGGDKATRAKAHLISHVMASVSPSGAPEAPEAAAQPPLKAPRTAAQRRQPPPPRTHARTVTDTAGADATTLELAHSSHADVLDRIRGYARPQAAASSAGGMAAVKLGATSVGAKQPHTTTAADTAAAGPAAQRQRFRVAEAWCSCPVGTLPSGVPRVGITPRFQRRVAVEEAAGSAGDAAATAEPGAAATAADGADMDVADGDASAGGGGVPPDAGEAREDAGMRAIEAAAARDVLVALGAEPGVADGDVEDAIDLGNVEGGSGGAVIGVDAAHGTRQDAMVEDRGGGAVGVLGLKAVVQRGLQGPVQDDELRERMLRACAAVLR